MNISNCEKKMKAYIIDKRLGHYTQISHHFFALLIDLRRFSTFESSISYNQISILTAPYQILFLVCWEFRWFQIVWWASSTYSLQQNDAFKFYPIIQKWPKRWDLRKKKKKNNPRTEGRMLELGLPRNQISHQNGFSAWSASKSTNCTPKRKFMRNQNCCVRVIVVKRNQNLWENIRIVVLWEIRFEKSSSMCFESCKQTLLDGDTN